MVNGLSLRGAIGLACVLSACSADRSSASPEQGSEICVAAGGSQPLRELPEASGLTLSHRTPGLLWSHNDSGPPAILAINASGAVQGRVQVSNATVDDWEDITAGPCPGGSCLYIADIGDNGKGRRNITIYRVPEPQPGDGKTAPAGAFTARYPDGAHDAEALFDTSHRGTEAPRTLSSVSRSLGVS